MQGADEVMEGMAAMALDVELILNEEGHWRGCKKSGLKDAMKAKRSWLVGGWCGRREHFRRENTP